MGEAAWRLRFKGPSLTLPVWARDNPGRLIYGSNERGKWEVYAWDQAADNHRQVTDRPAGTQGGAITPDGAAVLWFDDGAGSELGISMREPFEGGAAQLLSPDLPPAYRAGLALGKGLAVVGLSLPGIGTEVRLLRDGSAPRLIYKHRAAANVAALSRDDTFLCLMHTEQGDSLHRALRVMDLDGKTVGELFDGPDKDLVSHGFSEVRGDQRLLVAHQRRGRGELLIWEPVSGEQEELDIDLPGELSGAWYPDGLSVLVQHSHRGRSELLRFHLGSGELERLDVPQGVVTGASVRPDNEAWYGWSSSAAAPQIRAGERILLQPSGEPRPSGVRYTAHEVGSVPLFLAEPKGRAPYPTVFWVHGGPTGHDSDSYNPVVQAWVDHGYAVALVNYRGSTGYGLEWRDGLVGNPGLTELEDMSAVRRWLVSNGIADPDRILLAGSSWGGYLTVLGLGTQPDLWALGISGVPIADWLEQYDDVMEPLKAYDRALFGGSPEEIPEAYRRASPAAYVENVRVPVLILAGMNDQRCPIRQIESYVRKLETLEKPHEVYRYQAGHGPMVIEETLRQMEVRLAFAARHLGTPEPQ